MMEEVSITVAYDAHVFSQLDEEDTLANMVAVTKPKCTVGCCKLSSVIEAEQEPASGASGQVMYHSDRGGKRCPDLYEQKARG